MSVVCLNKQCFSSLLVAPVVVAAVNETVNTTLVGRYPSPQKPEICYNETAGAEPHQVVPCPTSGCDTGCIVGLVAFGVVVGAAIAEVSCGFFSKSCQKAKEKCGSSQAAEAPGQYNSLGAGQV